MITTPTLNLQSLFKSVDKMIETVTGSFSKSDKTMSSSSGLKIMKSLDKEFKNPSSAINGALAKGLEHPLTRGFSTFAYTLKASIRSYTTRMSSVVSGVIRTVFGKLVSDLEPLIESFKATMEFVRNMVLVPAKILSINIFNNATKTIGSIYTYLKERFTKNPVLVEMKKEFTLQNKQRKLFRQKKWFLRKIEWNTRHLNENTILSHINFISAFKRGVERRKNVKIARLFNVGGIIDTVGEVASAGVGIASTVTKVDGSILGGVNSLFQGLGNIIGMFGAPGKIIGTVIKVLPFVLGLVLFKGLWTMFKETEIGGWINDNIFVPFGKWFDKNKSDFYDMGKSIGKDIFNAVFHPEKYEAEKKEKQISELQEKINKGYDGLGDNPSIEEVRKRTAVIQSTAQLKRQKEAEVNALKNVTKSKETGTSIVKGTAAGGLVGGLAAMVVGGATGASVGSVAPVVGTLIGAGVGIAIAGYGIYKSKKELENVEQENYQNGGISNKIVPSLVMPGEYVIENATKKYSNDFIDNINNGIIKKYESGGLVSPSVSNVVTSNFGPRNTGLKGASTYHKGIDLRAPMGSPIKAIQNGVVVGTNNTWGKIAVKHSDGSISSYLHLSSIGVNRGENVQKGQRIGAAGKTGPIPGMAPHLHLSIQSPNGAYLNPFNVLSSSGIPLQQKGVNTPSTDMMYAQTGSSVGTNKPSDGLSSSTGTSISDMFKNAIFSSAELSGTTKDSGVTSLESAKAVLNGEIDRRIKENKLKLAQNRKKNNVSVVAVSGDNNQNVVSSPVPIFKTAFGV